MTVRVRIAPSPTGEPHVGTAYIGLLNYCFAKRHGGQFILRIEDTDRARCTAASAQAIYDSLGWLGLRYDEGPDVGGDRGPYVQSERVALGLYRRYADQLLEQGDAYHCFCTSEEIDGMRKRQTAAKQPIMYDRTHRDLPLTEGRSRAAAGEPHVIRMKSPLSGESVYPDRLRKKPVVKPWAEIDDQVLLKSDGWPTYHLAAVVDDHLMGITHVIRAEEWLNSLPKHLWLNAKLGFTAPEYVHVGLLRNADKSKISKRKNPTSLLWYREQGYLPAALLNFLALLGHSHPDGKEKFDLAEMCGFFDLDRINVAGPVFDLKKLADLQGQYFRELTPDAVLAEAQAALTRRFAGLYPLLRERVTSGNDVLAQFEPFVAAQVTPHRADLLPKGVTPEQAKAVLDRLHQDLRLHLADGKLWDAATLEALIKGLITERGTVPPEATAEQQAAAALWSPKTVFSLLRVAITGRTNTPPLFDTLAQVGALKSIERVAAAALVLRG